MLCRAVVMYRFGASSVGKSLKLLGLEPPTTKKQIKKAYFQLAKEHHPDADAAQSESQQQKEGKQNDKFIAITAAYKHLNELAEEQINRPQETDYEHQHEQDIESSAGGFSQQQLRRKATYDFFNRKQSYPNKPKLPLYRRHPQYFIGGALVMIFLWDWMVRSVRLTHTVLAHKHSKKPDQDAGKMLNFKQRYDGAKQKGTGAVVPSE